MPADFITPLPRQPEARTEPYVDTATPEQIAPVSRPSAKAALVPRHIAHDSDLIVPNLRSEKAAFAGDQVQRGRVFGNSCGDADAVLDTLLLKLGQRERDSAPVLEARPTSDAPTGSFQDLQEMVHRLTRVVAYYQAKYPATTLSVLGHELEVDARKSAQDAPQAHFALLHPLIKAYDEKLDESERLVRQLQGDIGATREKLRDSLAGSQAAFQQFEKDLSERSQSQESQLAQVSLPRARRINGTPNPKSPRRSLRNKTTLLERENALLLAEQTKNEALLQKSQTIQQSIPLLQNHISSLRALATTQSETITTLSTTNATLEAKLEDAADRIEHLNKRNGELLEKCVLFDNKTREQGDALEHAARAQESAVRWRKQHQGIVDDWQLAVETLGLTTLLGDNVLSIEALHFKNVLSNHVQRLQRDLTEAKTRAGDADAGAAKSAQELTETTQRFILELEKKSTELTFSKTQLEALTRSLDALRHERDQATVASQQAARESALLDTKLKDVIHQRDRDMADLLANTNGKLRRLHEDHDAERLRVQTQLEQLQQSKLELQCEVGHLLRDKRAAEFELEQNVRNMESQRESFRRDLGFPANQSRAS